MPTRWGRRALACAALWCVSHAGTALGQDPAATASQLFASGLEDMLAERFDTGCPALAESYRLDAKMGTLFTLAECENKAGRLGSAVRHYRAYLSQFAALTPDQKAGQRGREKLSAEALASIEPKAPKLTLILPPDAPPGTVVKRDGEVIDASALGQPVPVDPGEHLIAAEPPGEPVHETRLTLGLGESRELVVEVGPAPAAPSPVPTPEPAPEDSDDTGSTLRTTALVVGAVGLAALAVGGITGALAMSEHATAEDNCDGTVCNQEGLDAIDRTRPLGNASTALFVVGGVGLAAGVLLFVLAPSGESEEGTARRGWVLEPWVAGTREPGAVTGLRGAW